MQLHTINPDKFYTSLCERMNHVRKLHPDRLLTLTEKILAAHLAQPDQVLPARGESYLLLRPDRVAMQDATAQMAMLQLLSAATNPVAVPTSIHLDHLIAADKGAEKDLTAACQLNEEVYCFLSRVARRYGIGYWPAGAGIIHQVVLENYAMPGLLMVGTDSHTPNAGGIGTFAVGVGGADAVDVMVRQPWELRMPRIIGVRLTGSLSGWASPKDVVLHVLGKLGVKGGTGAVLEYFGPGVSSLSLTGRATICNMGAETGATTSLFPFDQRAAHYLRALGRAEVATWALTALSELRADPQVEEQPERTYDQVIDIDLCQLQPQLTGPFTPDAVSSLQEMPGRIMRENLPEKVSTVLIGSCTNSSYEDLTRAASVVRQALSAGLEPKARLIVCPGSDRIKATAERDGVLSTLRQAGAEVMTSACGPCIGQWNRYVKGDPAATERNTIVTTFNRNFARRADGNPSTFAFITSPEVAAALLFAGTLSFNPSTDVLISRSGREVRLLPPQGEELPPCGFVASSTPGAAPSCRDEGQGGKCSVEADASPVPERACTSPLVSPDSQRLQLLTPFQPWDGEDMLSLSLLIKVSGKCTTDHISPAGPWLRYRGHLENISRNLLTGALNAFTHETGRCVIADVCRKTKDSVPVWQAAAYYRDHCQGSVIVAEENYGEGSSREHAAMEPRYLGVRCVLAKSFARIHETNLKKQGVLALTFKQPDDYARILPGDTFSVHASSLTPGEPVRITVSHASGAEETIYAAHTYNPQQIAWLRAGSALAYICRRP